MANWDKLSTRGRVSDRRSQKSGGGSIFSRSGGSIFRPSGGSSGNQQMPINMQNMSGKTILIIFVGFILFSILSSKLPGADPTDSANQANQTEDTGEFAGEDGYEVFVSTVLGSNNAYWEETFEDLGEDYRDPELVLFRDSTSSACGGANSQTGPHYCPVDETIYIDERFFDEVLSRFGSEGGDVAEAYIISHEVGHHAQNLLGLTEQLNRARTSIFANNVNELSVELELQADCFAGLWANSVNDLGVFEGPAEIEEAISAAGAVGDDRIQQATEGRVDPESWTHGSSEQRVQWFNTGYVTGEYSECQI